MKIDSAGVPLPEPHTARRPDDLLWTCPNCAAPTWPGVDGDGRRYARRCVSCQIRYDETETHRMTNTDNSTAPARGA